MTQIIWSIIGLVVGAGITTAIHGQPARRLSKRDQDFIAWQVARTATQDSLIRALQGRKD